MKQPSLGRTPLQRLTVPPLSGGVSVAAPAHRLADHRLSEAHNLWWRHETLDTRPALRERGTLPHYAALTAAVPLSHHTLLWGQEGTDCRVALVGESGSLVGGTHTLPRTTAVLAVPDSRVSDESTADGSSDTTDSLRHAALLYLNAASAADRTVTALNADATLTPLSPYVPTVLTAARPTVDLLRTDSGACTEPFNLLTDDFRCHYTADGTGLYYWLPEGVTPDLTHPFTVRHINVDDEGVDHVLDYRDTDGVWKERADTLEDVPPDGLCLRYDAYRRCFWFVYGTTGGEAPILPGASGNVRLTATRTGGDDVIYGMRFGTWFGGGEGCVGGARLFLAGHPRHPHRIHWSALDQPLYFPENNYALVGDPGEPVTAFGRQSDMLVIFKERGTYATRYRTGTTVTTESLLDGTVTDPEATAVTFPLQQLHPERGCDCPDTLCLCGDRLVWASSDGTVYALYSGGTYDVHSVRALSGPVEPLLRAHTTAERRAATAAVVEEHYVLLLSTEAFVLSGSSVGFTAGTTASEATLQERASWQTWQFSLPETTATRLLAVRGTPFLIGTVGSTLVSWGFHTTAHADRVPVRTDPVQFADRPIACDLTTRLYELGAPTAYKLVTGVTLWVTGASGAALTVSLCDGTAVRRLATMTLHGDAPAETLPRYLSVQAPAVHRCALRLQSTGRLTVDGIELTFQKRGVIRRE